MKHFLIGLSLVLGILFSSIVSAHDEYNKVYVQTFGNGNPMMIYIGAEWCGPCGAMRNGPLPQIKAGPLFKHFNYLELDIDKDKDLIKRFKESYKLKSIKIPYIMFIQRDGKYKSLEGYRDYTTLENELKSQSTIYGKPRVIQP